MATASAQDDSCASTIDDTGRHSIELETLNDHTDQTPSTYDILEHALRDEPAVSQTNYSLSTLWDAFEHQSTMPGAHGGLKPWPNINQSTQEDHLRNASQHQARGQSSTATMRAHYESAQEPLSVSQQTSASSVRDMALRKGTPTLLHKDEPKTMRPLKSALKRYPSEQREVVAHPQFLYPPEHEQAAAKVPSRFARFGSFFSRRSSSNRSIPTPQVSRTPSTASTVSNNYARPPGPRQQRSIGWDQPLRQYDSAREQSDRSDLSAAVRQAKLADGGDVYEKAKVNIRRPPKGITNWFDAVDVSSEDDLTPVELPNNEAIPSTFTTFESERKAKPEAAKRSRQKESGEQLTKAERVLGQKTAVARYATETIDDQLLPIDRHDRFDDDDYFEQRAATPKSSQQMRSRSGRDTLMSMTSLETSDVDDTDGRPSTAGQYSSQSEQQHRAMNPSHGPHIPPRRLQNAQIAMHNAYHVNERPQLLSRGSASKHSQQSRRTYDSYENRSATPRKSTVEGSNRLRGRSSSNRLSSLDFDDSHAGGVPLDPTSPEISHMMTVTNDEMALLEMMRSKRAAMQKKSYPEGYRRALQKEHEQLIQRRVLAQQTALRILRTQNDQESVRQLEDVDESDLDSREIRKLHKLRQQERDRTKRLEKFLAMDTSLAAALDDAGVSQDELVQDWPLAKDDIRSNDARRSRKPVTSFSRRDAYGEDTAKPRHEKRKSAGINDTALPSSYADQVDGYLLPRHKHPRDRVMASDARSYSADAQIEAHRKSQAILARQKSADAAYRQELYMMHSQSTTRPTRYLQPARQQSHSTTFLRSISDYQPAEDRSFTSIGSPSVSASIVSPMTPSSTGGGPVGKLPGLDSLDGDYLDRSSPEMTFSKPAEVPVARMRKQQLPSALAILAESDRSSYRNSMASNNSAGEDVLAAWAELGGNEGMLPARTRRTRAN